MKSLQHMFGLGMRRPVFDSVLLHLLVLKYFLLTVKAATLIFISVRGSAISSA